MEHSEYRRIVQRYIDDVYRAALSCCHHRADAEDAVQDTFLKLLTAEQDFTDEEHIRRWLIRVTVNACKNRMNSFRRKRVCSLDELTQEPAAFSDDDRWLWAEVSRLPTKYSTVLHLYYYEGYRCAEIAELLHISESNVQTRLNRARKMLKQNLEEV